MQNSRHLTQRARAAASDRGVIEFAALQPAYHYQGSRIAQIAISKRLHVLDRRGTLEENAETFDMIVRVGSWRMPPEVNRSSGVNLHSVGTRAVLSIDRENKAEYPGIQPFARYAVLSIPLWVLEKFIIWLLEPRAVKRAAFRQAKLRALVSDGEASRAQHAGLAASRGPGG